MVRVRPGTRSDLPTLRTIQTAALAEPWPDLLDVAADEGGPLLLVVTAEGTPVGYAVALTASPLAYLPEVAVHPDRQREGLGSRLVEAVLDTLSHEGIERVRLTARAGDEAAIPFYERHGFQAVERVAGHFEDDDGLVLERRL